jgi:hypothetical protein
MANLKIRCEECNQELRGVLREVCERLSGLVGSHPISPKWLYGTLRNLQFAFKFICCLIIGECTFRGGEVGKAVTRGM